jgi:hypothetical protein
LVDSTTEERERIIKAAFLDIVSGKAIMRREHLWRELKEVREKAMRIPGRRALRRGETQCSSYEAEVHLLC